MPVRAQVLTGPADTLINLVQAARVSGERRAEAHERAHANAAVVHWTVVRDPEGPVRAQLHSASTRSFLHEIDHGLDRLLQLLRRLHGHILRDLDYCISSPCLNGICVHASGYDCNYYHSLHRQHLSKRSPLHVCDASSC